MMIFAPVYYRLKSEHGGKSETVTDIMLRSKKDMAEEKPHPLQCPLICWSGDSNKIVELVFEKGQQCFHPFKAVI